jgi:copper chaperone CopZ
LYNYLLTPPALAGGFQLITMKKMLFLFLLLQATHLSAQFTGATLKASGLTCAMCSKAVFNALSAVPYVEKVQPDIQASTYQISFKNAANIDPDLMARAVTDAGFSVAKLEMTGNFPETAIEKDGHVMWNNNVYHFVQSSMKTIKGKQTIRLVDKLFVSAKEHKNYGKQTTMACYTTGTRQSCCPSLGGSTTARIYHVIL